MAEISASMVRELREKSGAGMMQCKKALTETNGDLELAFDVLRKQGAAIAAKRADKETKEGKVFLFEKAAKAAVMEMNCETDFVAASSAFVTLGESLVVASAENAVASEEALMGLTVNGKLASESVTELVGKIGESIAVRRVKVLDVAADEIVALYSHMQGKIGVALKVKIEGFESANTEIVKEMARDLAMQVAATSPISVSEDEVDPAVVEKEKEIFRELSLQQGAKPEFLERVIEGKVKKFLKEVCLLEQVFVKDSKQTVNQLLVEKAKEAGAKKLTVVQFVRFELGK
jgi:elongation factor Ts